MANELISPLRFGELAAVWAPNVPKELVAAVLEQESAFGTNPNSMVPGVKGVMGPGQIQTAPGTHMAGQPQSLFEGFFPSSQLGRKGNPGNPEDLTISALRKMEADYAKGKGDIAKFSQYYFGAGFDKKLGITANEYTGTLVDKINNLKSNPRFADFTAGYAGLADPESSPKLNMSRPQSTAMAALPKTSGLSDKINAIMSSGTSPEDKASLYSALNFDVEAVVSSITKVAKMQAAVEDVKMEGSAMTAALAKKSIDAFGLDATTAGTTARQAADLLKKNLESAIRQQNNLDDNLANNPIYAMINGFTQGEGSKIIRGQIAAKLATVKKFSDGLQELEERGKQSIAIGSMAEAKITAASAEANKNLILAKAEHDVAIARQAGNKKLFDIDQKLETSDRLKKAQELNALVQDVRVQADIANKMSQLQQREAAIDKAYMQMNGTLPGVAGTKPLTPMQQLDFNKKQRAEKLALDEEARLLTHSAGLGMTPEALLAASKDNKKLDLLLNEDPKKYSPAALQTIRAEGKMSPDLAVLMRQTYENPTSPFAAIGLGKPDDPKLKPEEAYRIKNAAVQDRANALQGAIIHNGTPKSVEANPYAANFWTLEAKNTENHPVLKTPSTVAWQKTGLYKTLTEGKLSSSGEKLAVGDEVILEKAAILAKTPGYTTARAAQEVALYYKAAVETNNLVHRFSSVGLPSQSGYLVPIDVSPGFAGASKAGRYAFPGDVTISTTIALQGTPGKPGNFVPRIDLTDEVQVHNLIIKKLIGNI